jgi:hypothetical protein
VEVDHVEEDAELALGFDETLKLRNETPVVVMDELVDHMDLQHLRVACFSDFYRHSFGN